jgi:hypothetical protein
MIGLKIEKLITIAMILFCLKLLFAFESVPAFLLSIALSFLICHLTLSLQVLQLTTASWHQCKFTLRSVGLKQGTSAEVPVAAVPLAVPARPVDQCSFMIFL